MRVLKIDHKTARNLVVLGVIFSFLLVSCLKSKTIPYESDTIILRWHKSYDSNTFQNAIDALDWGLSHIGAKNRISSENQLGALNRLIVDPDLIGLPHEGEQVLRQLHTVLVQSEFYKKNGWLDVGQYLTFLIGSSPHYYALTGVPYYLNEWEEQYEILSVAGYINNSGISVNPREVNFSQQVDLNQFFVSKEIDSISNEALEFEAFDIMENGQLRFGVYDANGNRINVAAPVFSNAGKPGKCMWCHESAIQPLLSPQINLQGYLPAEQLDDTLWYYRLNHKNQQALLLNGVDFTDMGGHVGMELSYISYLEPSAEQLALEWGVEVEEVLSILSELETHEQEEYPFLGERFWRHEVNEFSPISFLASPKDVRESTGQEINLLE